MDSEPKPKIAGQEAINLFEGDSWVLPTDPDLKERVLEEIEGRLRVLDDTDWEEKDILDFLTYGVGELFTNAVIHGNLCIDSEVGGDERVTMAREMIKRDSSLRQKSIKTEFKVDSDKVTFSVEDEGPGFDWKGAQEYDPTLPENLLKTRGRGIYFTRTYMILEYNEKGNKATVTLSKTRHNKS
jgi:anti-sigma regulatory factor (Ser/Thr protein kinase)